MGERTIGNLSRLDLEALVVTRKLGISLPETDGEGPRSAFAKDRAAGTLWKDPETGKTYRKRDAAFDPRLSAAKFIRPRGYASPPKKSGY